MKTIVLLLLTLLMSGCSLETRVDADAPAAPVTIVTALGDCPDDYKACAAIPDAYRTYEYLGASVALHQCDIGDQRFQCFEDVSRYQGASK